MGIYLYVLTNVRTKNQTEDNKESAFLRIINHTEIRKGITLSDKQINIKQIITEGKTSLGIEFGSTRIKAVLIDHRFKVISSGSYEWENRLENGYWTYSLENIITGMQTAYDCLRQAVERNYGVTIRTIGSIGISAMMHGYMAFDNTGELLVPFRTWRNSTTGDAARELTDRFSSSWACCV